MGADESVVSTGCGTQLRSSRRAGRHQGPRLQRAEAARSRGYVRLVISTMVLRALAT